MSGVVSGRGSPCGNGLLMVITADIAVLVIAGIAYLLMKRKKGDRI